MRLILNTARLWTMIHARGREYCANYLEIYKYEIFVGKYKPFSNVETTHNKWPWILKIKDRIDTNLECHQGLLKFTELSVHY